MSGKKIDRFYGKGIDVRAINANLHEEEFCDGDTFQYNDTEYKITWIDDENPENEIVAYCTSIEEFFVQQLKALKSRFYHKKSQFIQDGLTAIFMIIDDFNALEFD